jgi:hypothetical protein
MHTTSETAVTASDISMGASLTARIRLVATTCCVCDTPLADATSVELGIGPTCRKRLAKLDVTAAAAPNWDAVTDALAEFAAINRNDVDRLALFEMAMDQIALARMGADHKLANLITHYIAATQARRDSISGLILAIERRGRPNLAQALRKRQYEVRVEAVDDMLHVFTPFMESFRSVMWRRSLGRWNRDLKCYVVPGTRKVELRAALGESYAGMRAIDPDGEFTVERTAPVIDESPKIQAVVSAPVFSGRVGRNGDIGYIFAGPNAGKSGIVFWQATDKSRVGVKSCACTRRCNHEPLWCNARDVSTEHRSTARAA